jgi:hypothetical protein
MSRGLGQTQRECLRVIADYEREGRKPTTFNIAAEVYRVKRDRHGDRMVNDAQHTATKRALSGLRRKGLVEGQKHPEQSVCDDYGHYNGRSERCCFWRTRRC